MELQRRRRKLNITPGKKVTEELSTHLDDKENEEDSAVNFKATMSP